MDGGGGGVAVEEAAVVEFIPALVPNIEGRKSFNKLLYIT